MLERLLKARLSVEEYEAFVNRHPNRDRGHYAAAFEELVRRTELPESRLRALAASRAQAIEAQLVARGIDRSRITSSEIRPTADNESPSVDARLDLQARAE